MVLKEMALKEAVGFEHNSKKGSNKKPQLKIKAKKIGKKGFFFSFMALFLVILFILIFSDKPKIASQEDIIINNANADTLSFYTKNVADSYIKRAMISAMHKSLYTMLIQINSSSAEFADLNKSFSELMLYGQINGTNISTMENSTISYFVSKVTEIAENTFRINFSLYVYNITVWQKDPWLVSVGADIILNSSKGNAAYNIHKRIITNISIIGYDDPGILYSSYKNYSRAIKVLDTLSYNYSTLRRIIKYNYYRQYKKAPSYLQRLSGNLSSVSDCCGIETVLNTSFGLPSGKARPFTDYLFLNGTNCSSTLIYNISGLTDDSQPFNLVVLDTSHIFEFNVTAEASVENICP